ncbi:MAG: DUF4145 domain-containing protein [Fibrobacterota bacterium]
MNTWRHSAANHIITRLHNEIYKTLSVDAHVLAMMGIRSLIDEIIKIKLGVDGTFKQNLESFYEKRHISEPDKKTIETVLGLGHAATHRGHVPKKEDVNAALDICETLMQTVIINPIKAGQLKFPEKKKS